ncbi:hypothetical protein DMB37_36640 [Nocardia sp. CS682]|nr:hypothetical protein DMB37_36640 [Nocardia sp. CS682]
MRSPGSNFCAESFEPGPHATSGYFADSEDEPLSRHAAQFMLFGSQLIDSADGLGCGSVGSA